MNRYFRVVGVSSPGPQMQQVAEDEGIKTMMVEMARDISLFKDLKALWQLVRLIKREQPAIVHTHTPKAGTLGIIAAWLCRVPVRLHTVAGLPLLEASGFKRRILNTVEKITYACATKVYPNSFGLKEIIVQNKFCKASKLKVIGNGSSNGIDTSHFAPGQILKGDTEKLKTQLGLTPDCFVFTFMGRLVKEKGINELVQAFKNIEQKHDKIKLLLVGDSEPELDPLLPKTEQEIHENTNIITTGFQSDVRPYLAVSNALVFPSYREGFPNVPMQALAMEVPAIVTDINGCNEIVKHEKNGLIIRPKNTEAIIESMKRIMLDKPFYDKLKENARESIVSRFDQLTLWKQIKEEYDEQLRIAGLT